MPDKPIEAQPEAAPPVPPPIPIPGTPPDAPKTLAEKRAQEDKAAAEGAASTAASLADAAMAVRVAPHIIGEHDRQGKVVAPEQSNYYSTQHGASSADFEKSMLDLENHLKAIEKEHGPASPAADAVRAQLNRARYIK